MLPSILASNSSRDGSAASAATPIRPNGLSTHEPAAHLKRIHTLGEVRYRLCHGDHVAVRECNAARAIEQCGEISLIFPFRGQPQERVLCYLELAASGPELPAERLHLPYCEAPVIGDNDQIRAAQPLAQFLDDYGFSSRVPKTRHLLHTNEKNLGVDQGLLAATASRSCRILLSERALDAEPAIMPR